MNYTTEMKVKDTANALIDRYDFGAIDVARKNAANGRYPSLREFYMKVVRYLEESASSLLADLGTDELAKRAMCRAMGTVVDEDVFDTSEYDPEA